MSKLLSFLARLYFSIFGIKISRGTIVNPIVFLSKGYQRKKGSIKISRNCEISRGCVFKAYGGSINIGANTFVGEYVIIYGHGGVEIGENTLIAMHTCIVSANHTIPKRAEIIRSMPDILIPVKIGDDVWIGANASILAGVVIGKGAIIGANSVVTRDIPDFAIAFGNPARVIRYRA